jgi:hypothetical protein
VVVVSVAVALDALAAELRRHADTQAIIEAMTTKANEFFFLAAVSIAAYCSSMRRAPHWRLAACGRECCPAAKAAKRRSYLVFVLIDL